MWRDREVELVIYGANKDGQYALRTELRAHSCSKINKIVGIG